jgi:hypothetical protein
LILHAWSIFFKGAYLTKLRSKKIFSMETLSKLGALTVCSSREGSAHVYMILDNRLNRYQNLEQVLDPGKMKQHSPME